MYREDKMKGTLKRLMKKTAAVLLAAAMLGGGTGALAAGTTVSVGSVSAKAGETVTVDVYIEGNSGLTNFDLAVKSDDSLKLTSVEKDGCVCADGMLAANAEAGLVSWINSSENRQESGTLFRLTFTVDASASAGEHEVSVALREGGAFSGESGSTAVSFVSGSVNVTASGGTTGGADKPGTGGTAGSGSTGTTGGTSTGGSDTQKPELKQVYSDVAPGAWYFQCVGELSASGVVSGYPDGSFKPAGTVTYAEALKLILLASGYPAFGASSGRHWAAGYYDFAVERSFIAQGIGLDTPITRLEIAHITARAAGLSAKNASPFTDCTDADAAAMYEAGLVIGYGDLSFSPDKTISRAEMAMIIWRLYAYAETGTAA